MKMATLFMVLASSGGIRSRASFTAASKSVSDIGNGGVVTGAVPAVVRPSGPLGMIGRPGGREAGIAETLAPNQRDRRRVSPTPTRQMAPPTRPQTVGISPSTSQEIRIVVPGTR